MNTLDKILKTETYNGFEVFYQHVHPDENVRNESRKKEVNMKNEVNNLYCKLDYEKYKDLNDPISLKIKEKLIRLGQNLDPEKQKQCKDIESQLEKLYTEFNKNVAASEVKLSAYDENQISDLIKKYNINPGHINNSSYSVIMTECAIESVRKNCYQQFNNQALGNKKIIPKILQLRQKLAKLNGFDNYTDFNTQFSYDTSIIEFDTTLFEKQMLKDTEFLAKHFSVSRKHLLKVYNYAYYCQQYKKSISVDCKENKYFKFTDVVEKIKVFYNMILGYNDKESSFEEIEKLYNIKIQKWDADVYKHENGFLILDLQARKGKFPHPSCFPIIRRHKYSNGTLQKTVVCLLANINDEYLTLGETKTLLHEFGHAVHELLNVSNCGLVGGTAIKRDLVEIPSMFMEKMFATPQMLKLLSFHQCITDEIARKIIKSAKMLNADFYLKQIMFSRFDLMIHSNKQVDLDKILLLNTFTSDMETNILCRFVHFTGYACSYYSYIMGMICGKSLFKNREYLYKNGKMLKYKEYLQSTNPDIKKLIKIDPYSLLE